MNSQQRPATKQAFTIQQIVLDNPEDTNDTEHFFYKDEDEDINVIKTSKENVRQIKSAKMQETKTN